MDAVDRLSVREEASGRYQREYVLDVQLRDEAPSLSTMATVTYNNRPADEWIKAYIRALLFDQPMPEDYGPLGRGGGGRPDFRLPEIYEALKDRGRVDELFPSLARVYLLDRLLRAPAKNPPSPGRFITSKSAPCIEAEPGCACSTTSPSSSGKVPSGTMRSKGRWWWRYGAAVR